MKDLIEKKDYDTKIKCQFTSSNRVLQLPRNEIMADKKPLIIICHGTGVSPFISILKRILNELKVNDSLKLGSIVMFNGIRNDTTDFLFKEFLTSTFETLEKKSEYCKLKLACSRDISNETSCSIIDKIKGYV